MLELCVDVSWVRDPLIAHKRKDGCGLVLTRFRPLYPRRAWVQERMRVARQESVIDEEVFFNRELWITTLKIAGAIVAHTMAQGKILGARWCANWIGLDKAQAVNRAC
jgi:hypothetical protein